MTEDENETMFNHILKFAKMMVKKSKQRSLIHLPAISKAFLCSAESSSLVTLIPDSGSFPCGEAQQVTSDDR